MTQASATRMPATTPTNLGPILSTRYPSNGTSHVSTTTNTENANWIAEMLQWWRSWMGLTKSVQPYCRLAIIDMQMIPSDSCHHRPNRMDGASSRAIVAASVT